MAATFLWQSTTGGDFDAPGNWQLSSGSSSLGYPGAADTAVFGGTVGGTILTSTAAQVDTLDLTAAAWVLSGQITANTVNISNGSALGLSASGQLVANNVLLVSSGTVNVIAGTLAVAGTATPTVFGTGGTGALNVTNHGIASFSGALTIGTAGSGSADVDAGVLTVGGLLQLGSGVAGSNGALYVADSGSVFLTSASDSSKSYLQLGAISGTAGFVQVSGAESLLSVTSNSGQVGGSGSGALNVLNGGTANFRSTNNGLDPALNVGVLAGGAGAILVSGGGSTLGVNGSIRVGVSGRGTLQVTGGGSVTSAGFTATQAALAVAAGLGGSGSVTIDGAGSQLAANGTVVVGGDNRGSGLVLGGIGTISVTNGGFLQSGTMTIAAGSTVGVDAASQDDVSGDLNVAGTLTNVGTLIVSGTLSGAGTLQLAGGFASVGSLSSASVGFVGPNATLRVSALTGTSTISGIQYGDQIDLAGDSAVRLTNNTVITTAGSLTLAGAPADTQYELTQRRQRRHLYRHQRRHGRRIPVLRQRLRDAFLHWQRDGSQPDHADQVGPRLRGDRSASRRPEQRRPERLAGLPLLRFDLRHPLLHREHGGAGHRDRDPVGPGLRRRGLPRAHDAGGPETCRFTASSIRRTARTSTPTTRTSAPRSWRPGRTWSTRASASTRPLRAERR